MSEVWLLRHATPKVAPGTCYGALDMPADEAHTVASANAFWQAWDAEHGGAPASLLCSPLLRCVQLGKALQNLRPGVDLRLESDLREMNFGCWEGRAWSGIPKAAIDTWTNQFASHAFGGVESVQALIGRVGRVWDSHLATDSLDRPCPRIWITHAGVIKAAQWWVQSGGQAITRADQWPSDPCAFGAWRKLSVAG